MQNIVIIPAYNPDEQLIALTEELWGYENEVVIVDDGSDMEKSDIFRRCEGMATVVHHEKNRGKGAAIKTALAVIAREFPEAEVIGVMDADGQHRPQDMEKLLLYARQEKDALVLGVREIGDKMPWKSRLGNTVSRLLFRFLSGTWLSDTQSGLRAFGKELLPSLLEVQGERYEYETNVLLALVRAKIPIEELPIETIYHDSRNSCSHFRAVRDTWRIFKDAVKFGLFSVSSFVVDYALFLFFSGFFGASAAGGVMANVLARIVSGCYNYYVNCRFVFGQKKSVETGVKYFLLAVGILAANSVLLCLYERVLPPYLAKLFTEMTLFVLSFTIQRFFIYRTKNVPKEIERQAR